MGNNRSKNFRKRISLKRDGMKPTFGVTYIRRDGRRRNYGKVTRLPNGLWLAEPNLGRRKVKFRRLLEAVFYVVNVTAEFGHRLARLRSENQASIKAKERQGSKEPLPS